MILRKVSSKFYVDGELHLIPVIAHRSIICHRYLKRFKALSRAFVSGDYKNISNNGYTDYTNQISKIPLYTQLTQVNETIARIYERGANAEEDPFDSEGKVHENITESTQDLRVYKASSAHAKNMLNSTVERGQLTMLAGTKVKAIPNETPSKRSAPK